MDRNKIWRFKIILINVVVETKFIVSFVSIGYYVNIYLIIVWYVNVLLKLLCCFHLETKRMFVVLDCCFCRFYVCRMNLMCSGYVLLYCSCICLYSMLCYDFNHFTYFKMELTCLSFSKKTIMRSLEKRKEICSILFRIWK